MVRMAGFEPALSWSRTKHFTKLSYILIARIFYHILNEKKRHVSVSFFSNGEADAT
jgi:hypothetical protein